MKKHTLMDHLETQGKVNFLSCLIKAELDKLENDPENKYYGSEANVENEKYILKKASDLFGYDYEADDERNDYCLKATPVEIWQYWMREIMPRF